MTKNTYKEITGTEKPSFFEQKEKTIKELQDKLLYLKMERAPAAEEGDSGRE